MQLPCSERMIPMKYTLAQNIWYGNEPVSIDLPDNWRVQFLSSGGDEYPALTEEEIRARFRTAVGTKPIRELAEGKEQVAIVFDDLTRATPAEPIAEVLLEYLLAAGIKKKNIRFICGLGLHGALMHNDFVRKLGERIVREYPIYNHNPYESCVEIGVTPKGVKVSINKEFMACDLKIGIGGLVPHPLNGFGGGGKVIMPGVASAETIYGTHMAEVKSISGPGKNPLAGSGNLSIDVFRSEVEAVSRIAGLDFVINALINTKVEMFDLVMGDPIDAYYEGVKRAKGMYGVKLDGQKQVVIANANAKASEAAIAYYTGMMALEPTGGDIVLVNFTPGQCVHYGSGPMGENAGGRTYGGVKDRPGLVKRLVVYSPYPDYTSASWFCKPEQLMWAESWEEVMAIISDNGPGTRAGIFADATLQFIEW